jgi:hypothetical protein
MDIITAGIVTAMTGGGPMIVPQIICDEPRPPVERLLSERMPMQRLWIQVSVQPTQLSAEMSDAVHAAILRSFEHQYHI